VWSSTSAKVAGAIVLQQSCDTPLETMRGQQCQSGRAVGRHQRDRLEVAIIGAPRGADASQQD
jgi:hypothetical protein